MTLLKKNQTHFMRNTSQWQLVALLSLSKFFCDNFWTVLVLCTTDIVGTFAKQNFVYIEFPGFLLFFLSCKHFFYLCLHILIDQHKNPLKSKRLFILRWKFHSFWRYLNFYIDFFAHAREQVDNKAKVSFKIHDAINGKAGNKIFIFPNISRSKGNQSIKFSQLIEYDKRNSFLKNHIQHVKIVPKCFLKNKISGSTARNFMICFYCISK